MNKIRFALMLIALPLLSAPALLAQNPPMTPEEEERQLREGIDREVDRLTLLLDLEDWQVFYVDSTLSYNYQELILGRDALRQAKVSNADLYYLNADKWNEATYEQFRRIFTDQQWEKYLRSGARKEKKARDKRAAKIAEASLPNKNQK